jgi:hypothetical protein
MIVRFSGGISLRSHFGFLDMCQLFFEEKQCRERIQEKDLKEIKISIILEF